MNRDQLQQLQRPLKDRYRDDPAAAQTVFLAAGTLFPAELICRLESGSRSIHAGLHPNAGGEAGRACSAELLLESLVACAGVTLLTVATALEIEVSTGHVVAEGQLDFRGTLAVDREVPVGLSAIRLTFQLTSSANEEQLTQLLALTERYCVVLQTLRNSTAIDSSVVVTAA